MTLEINASIFKNYLTTLFGIMAGLPVLALGAWEAVGLGPLSIAWDHRLKVTAGLGIIGFGIVAKAFNVVPTASEVKLSTIKNPDVEDKAKKILIDNFPPVDPVPVGPQNPPYKGDFQ